MKPGGREIALRPSTGEGRDGGLALSTVLADTLAYEQENNPDQVNSYGFQGLSAECAALVPAEIGGGAPHNFEPVPIDVEIGDDGMLYVSTLPGGPEGPELGAHEQRRLRHSDREGHHPDPVS